MTGELRQYFNVFVQLKFIRSFPKCILRTSAIKYIYMVNSIDENYLSLPFANQSAHVTIRCHSGDSRYLL